MTGKIFTQSFLFVFSLQMMSLRCFEFIYLNQKALFGVTRLCIILLMCILPKIQVNKLESDILGQKLLDI